MPRTSQFTDEQIIRALREVDQGAKPADVYRRVGVTEKTFYRWRSKFGGMDVSESKRLRALDDENAKLKKLLADQMLDNAALKAVLGKNGEACGQAPCRGLPPADGRAAGGGGGDARRQCDPAHPRRRAGDAAQRGGIGGRRLGPVHARSPRADRPGPRADHSEGLWIAMTAL